MTLCANAAEITVQIWRYLYVCYTQCIIVSPNHNQIIISLINITCFGKEMYNKGTVFRREDNAAYAKEYLNFLRISINLLRQLMISH